MTDLSNVVAADGLRGALVAAENANDADGRAGEADHASHALNGDAQQPKESGPGGRVGLKPYCEYQQGDRRRRTTHLLSRIAALDGTGAAAAGGSSCTSDVHGGGDRKDGEGKGCKSGELGEHLGCDELGAALELQMAGAGWLDDFSPLELPSLYP